MATVAERELRVVNPASLEVVATVPATAPESVQEVVAEARLAQEAWARTSHAERGELLAAVSELVLDHADEIADTVVAETAKPRVEAYTSDLFPAVDTVVWLASAARHTLAPEPVRYSQLLLRHKRAWFVYEPLGVIGVVAPWNLPFAIPFTQAAAAVVAGNAVVLKPSELTPLSGAWIERLFAQAGAPPGLVRVVQGDGAVGDALVRARGIAKVLFTGSADVGRRVAAAAGANLVPVVLELGGKDPMLVLDDVDLDRAVEGAVWGAYLNAGQICSGVERIFVQQPLYDEFTDALVRRARELRIGEDVGPLISEERRTKVAELVDEAVDHGAEVLTGGRAPERTGWFYEPTVLAGVARDANVEREEVFGPIVTVAEIESDAAAIRAANDGPFGLGASVWTRDDDRARRIAERLEVGSVWHNDVAYSYGAAQASWGGRKQSGFGRTHSKHGLYELSAVKLVDRDAGNVRVPWWYPYDERAASAFAAVLPVLYRRGLRGKLLAAVRRRHGLVAAARRYLR
jgi:succinate-semialdehyde dehydrogenase/glutarate-semialdehyde dehydrogenase